MGDHSTNIAEAVYFMVKGPQLLSARPKADVTGVLTTGGPLLPITGVRNDPWLMGVGRPQAFSPSAVAELP